MSTVKITPEQLKETLSTQFVNCDKALNTIYKYMTLSRVLEILENKTHQIGFVSPENWNDPYEIKFLNTDYTVLNGYKQPKIYCFCVRMDNINEEASWKIYKKENEPLLRMTIKTNSFLSSLKDFAQKYECNIYFSKVDYRLSSKEINTLHLPKNPYYHEFFDDFDDMQYVKLMSLKRRAFSYENEYRIFMIPKNHKAVESLIINNILFVPIDLKMISRFTINPEDKLDETLSSQINHEKYLAECKFIKKRIRSSYPEVEVYISGLYSKVKNVEKIENA